MNLLADVIIPGHYFGQVTEPAPGSDAFVLVTLGLLAFLFGAFSIAALVLWHRGQRPSPHRRLLMEMEEEQSPSPASETRAAGPEHEAPRQPWEQRADWWKDR